MILGIDTAGGASSVALVDETQILASLYLQHALPLATHLLDLVDTLCTQVGRRVADLAGLAVNLGPGGFTSLRVGLATAQGLAMALHKPLVGCSTFEALVASATGWEGALYPVLDARRGEVYAAGYRRQCATLHTTMLGAVLTPEALCAQLPERALLLGSGVRTYRALFMAALPHQVVCLEMLTEGAMAVQVAQVGQERLRTGEAVVPPGLTPLYIRAADARLPRHPVSGEAPDGSQERVGARG